MPPQLGNLANLEVLDLSGNQLSGEIPPQLGNLANLGALYLSNNQLSGEIPPQLGNLANLGALYLSNNQLSGEIPAELGNLANLEVLYLQSNQLTGCVPAGLRDVPYNDLDRLGLDFCEMEVPGAPTGLTAEPSETEARVNLSWTAPISSGGAPITGYLIESSPDGNDPWAEVFTTTGDGTAYTDEGDDSNGPMFGVGATQYYRVSASNSVGTGEPSNAAIAQDLVARYDANDNGMVDRGEVITAIRDYFADQVSRVHVIGIIRFYFTGPPTGDDRAALVALYNATNGPHWANSAHWLSDRPLGEWHGVTTNAAGRVTELSLTVNRLSGEMPSELGDLTNLESLRLGGNQLTGEIPPELDSLANLEWLNLGGNQLTGEIPAALGNLANLEWLELYNNQLSGEIPAALGGLANLEWLELGGNQLDNTTGGSLLIPAIH